MCYAICVCVRWRSSFDTIREYSSFADAKMLVTSVNGLYDDLMEGRSRVADFRQRERLFNLEYAVESFIKMIQVSTDYNPTKF